MKRFALYFLETFGSGQHFPFLFLFPDGHSDSGAPIKRGWDLIRVKLSSTLIHSHAAPKPNLGLIDSYRQILCPGHKMFLKIFRNISCVHAACNNVAALCHRRATSQDTMFPILGPRSNEDETWSGLNSHQPSSTLMQHLNQTWALSTIMAFWTSSRSTRAHESFWECAIKREWLSCALILNGPQASKRLGSVVSGGSLSRVARARIVTALDFGRIDVSYLTSNHDGFGVATETVFQKPSQDRVPIRDEHLFLWILRLALTRFGCKTRKSHSIEPSARDW